MQPSISLKCPKWHKAILATLKVISKSPKKQERIAKLATNLLLATNINRIQIMRTNLELCFPQKNTKLLLKQSITNTIQSILELIYYSQNNNLTATYQGIENFKNQITKPQGILLIHPHNIHMNLAGSIAYQLTMQLSNKQYGYIYRKSSNEQNNNTLQYLRYKLGPKATWIDARQIKKCITFLEKGGILMTFPDHDLGPKRSVFSDFFNIPTATCPGFAKMASLANAICIPTTLHKNKNQYNFIIEQPIDTTKTPQDTANWLNQWVEKIINNQPTDYFWPHKRFKTRPPNSKSFYQTK